MQHIVILGAGYAGLLSALRLQPQIKQGKARVTLVNGSDTFTERIRNHQVASGQTIKQHNISDFIRGTGIEFVQDMVRHINSQEQLITLDDYVLDYDILIVALGSVVNRDAIEGVRDHTYTLDKISSIQLQKRLENGGRLLIIGGGLTGIEAATEFAERPDVDVHLVTQGVVGAELSDNGRNHIQKILVRMGVTVHEHMQVDTVHEDYIDSSQGTIRFDACLWAGGFMTLPLIRESGFAVNTNGQMLLRDTLQSVDYDNVYGAGDVVSVIMENGNPLRMACAVAMPMGSHVADNVSASLNSKLVKPFRFSYAIQCISLGRHNALVQLQAGDGTPKDQIFTGRLGAFVKENICRYTIFSLQLEKRLPGSYMYPKGVTAESDLLVDEIVERYEAS
jgi:NADH:ubiquinone reductase (H+-translocating)